MKHKLLKQQITDHLPDSLAQDKRLHTFLAKIDAAYTSFDRDRLTTEQAFRDSGIKSKVINQELNTLADQRLLALKELNDAINNLEVAGHSNTNPKDLAVLSEKIRRHIDLNKITEDTLSRNNNFFKKLLASLQSGVLIENEHREILFANKLFCDFFRISAPQDELIGADCSESARQSMGLFKEPEKFVRQIDQLLKNQEAVYNEILETVDGRILERDYVPIFIEGIYKGHFWQYTDITDKTQYQKNLRASEEKNRLVMNSSLDAIVITDNKGKVTSWNPRAEQLLGWTKEEAIGLPMTDLFIPSHMHAAHNNGMDRYLNSGVSHILNKELELTAVNKAGEQFPVELIIVTYEHNGKRFFCGFMKDISSRKNAENQLKAQEEKYRNIITNMNLGLLEVDTEETILFANQRFCEMSGYEAHELIGGKTERFLLTEQDETILKNKRQLRAEGVSDSYEIAIKNKAGEIRWWFISGAPNYNDQGELVGSIGIHLDITEQKELETALAVAKTKAEEASFAKEAFLANMSHEIRTPLNAIIGMVRELSREELSPKQQTYLSHTDTATRHLLSIVNNILDISKIEAGELELDEQDFSLQALIANIISILHFKASKKSVELFSYISEAAWPAFKGDSARIRQILLNVLDNAIKFTIEGSVKLAVNVEQETKDQQQISFIITDTGIGMDEAYMEQLFSKFSQAEKSTSRSFGGTGLGMSITKKIVTLMNGTIEVKSKKYFGSQFKILISLKKGDINLLFNRTQEREQSLKGLHILLVEDNPMNRFIAQKSLSHFGCSVDEAENGLDALLFLKRSEYDIILMDIQMPKLDGVATTKIIREELKLCTPIIAVTANAFKKDIDLYLSIGMNDYVTKPFKENHLFDTIANQLEKRVSSVPEPTQPSSKSYNLDRLITLSKGDKEFVNNMVDVFLQHTPLTLAEIEIALATKDYTTLGKTTHKIKPSIDIMGISKLKGIAKDIELLTKNKPVDHSTIAENVNFLLNTLSQVLEEIKQDHA